MVSSIEFRWFKNGCTETFGKAVILGIGIDFGAGVKFNPLDNAFFSIKFCCRDEWLITHLSVHS